jgi:hypothetical protein
MLRLLLLLSLHEAWFLWPLIHLPTHIIILFFTAAAPAATLLLLPLLLLTAALLPILCLPLFAFFFISAAAAALLLLLPVSAALCALLLGSCFGLPPFHLLMDLIMKAACLQYAHGSSDTTWSVFIRPDQQQLLQHQQNPTLPSCTSYPYAFSSAHESHHDSCAPEGRQCTCQQ